MKQDELYKQIVSEYLKCGSVKQTAVNTGTSLVRAQRVLITEGLWHSETSDAVCKLFEQGKTTQEIADSLFISVKTVQAYLPYTKGFYSSDKSSEAVRSDFYRIRKLLAADKQVHRTIQGGEDTMSINALSVQGSGSKDQYKVMRLRLELIFNPKDRRLMNTLRKYANVKEGIVREILVPSDISLHKLNYAIQKCFGWENSHLHHFELPSSIFAELTNSEFDGEDDNRFSYQNGSFIKWADYCGTYFRFPSEDWDDIYWDDDYKGDVSFKSWLKRKYNGPNYYLGNSEHFVCARKAAEEFIRDYPVIRVVPYFVNPGPRNSKSRQEISKPVTEATVREISIMFESSLYQLLERLPLCEVLFAQGDQKPSEIQLSKQQKERTDLYRSCINKYVYIKRGINRSVNDSAWSEDNIAVLPVTDELIYNYDYGDDWRVRITCDEKYCFKYKDNEPVLSSELSYEQLINDKVRLFNQKDELILDDDECEDILSVFLNRRLKCTYVDGLNVLDDVGGVYGFADFLKQLHEGELEDSESIKAWASGMGWTGRQISPKNIL